MLDCWSVQSLPLRPLSGVQEEGAAAAWPRGLFGPGGEVGDQVHGALGQVLHLKSNEGY